MKAIIFDLDGTLYQTEKVAVPAFRLTFEELQQKSLLHRNMPSNEEFESVFGMTGAEFWPRLLPKVPRSVHEEADRRLLFWEIQEINRGNVECYPFVKDTLRSLQRKGYVLFIASNGLKPYVEAVLQAAELDQFFLDIYTASEYQTASKVDLVRICMEKYNINMGYMVGDRRSDVNAGKENNLISIACCYKGFPSFATKDELLNADTIIDSFDKLLKIVK